MDNYQDNDQEAIRHLLDKERTEELYQQFVSKKKNKKTVRLSIIAVIIISLISGLAGGAIAFFAIPQFLPYTDIGDSPSKVEIYTKDVPLDAAAAVAEKVLPSVVGISTQVVYNSFFGRQTSEGVGTGVIVDKNGYILTNSHVVNNGNMQALKVLLNDGRELEGKLLWNDAIIDLAIVKVDAQNLTPAELGNSDELRVGEYAVAIGNPLGFQFERTVTQGIISGLNRTIPISNYESIEGLIQTDASINPGNSGGPLCNQYGQVIGINTAKIQSGEGLGFAIPINIAQPIVQQYIEKGEFKKAVLGIKAVNVEQYLQSFNEDLGVNQGVYIYQIFTDSAAAKAGLKEEDIIIRIENKDIANMSQLVSKLYQYRPGDTIEIEVVRDKNKMTLQVTLKETTDVQ
ncbi:MAG: PDZ domain-containing protein [Clostridiales bacterium]|nr:PDZ domain-containing protein [Clostridiales bacterium]